MDKDVEARTMTITSEFDATVAAVWQLWADPKKLERWWGPPTNPATVVELDLRPGGAASYFVAGPDGERHTGSWRVLEVDEPHGLVFELQDPTVPTTTVRVRIDDRPGGGTRMIIEVRFPTDGAMDQLLSLGFDTGMATAIGQMDDVLR